MTFSKNKNDIKVLLLEGVHESALQTFQRSGYTNVEQVSSALTGDALTKKLQTANIVGIRSSTQLTEAVLKQSKSLFAVGCFCIGTNQVNKEAAALYGIPVFNAPYSNTRSVAELVIAQMILLMRGIPEKNAKAHRGEWQKSATYSYEVRGKALGIIGYGHIGSQVSVLAESLGLKVIFYDVENKLPLGNANPVFSLSELLAQSDIVSLHVPETASTKNMMHQKTFAQMKDHSVFINASRGTVVDIDALVEVLQQGKLLGAAVDVFPIEPKSNADEFISPLIQFDNVLLTPHVGGSTVEAQKNIGQEVAEKIVKYSDNGSTVSAVNFPEASLPLLHEGACRILHVHHNQPGMMRLINRIFSELEINIVGQYLQTNNDIGYVVMDIESTHDKARTLLQQLRTIEGTIRVRVLF